MHEEWTESACSSLTQAKPSYRTAALMKHFPGAQKVLQVSVLRRRTAAGGLDVRGGRDLARRWFPGET